MTTSHTDLSATQSLLTMPYQRFDMYFFLNALNNNQVEEIAPLLEQASLQQKAAMFYELTKYNCYDFRQIFSSVAPGALYLIQLLWKYASEEDKDVMIKHGFLKAHQNRKLLEFFWDVANDLQKSYLLTDRKYAVFYAAVNSSGLGAVRFLWEKANESQRKEIIKNLKSIEHPAKSSYLKMVLFLWEKADSQKQKELLTLDVFRTTAQSCYLSRFGLTAQPHFLNQYMNPVWFFLAVMPDEKARITAIKYLGQKQVRDYLSVPKVLETAEHQHRLLNQGFSYHQILSIPNIHALGIAVTSGFKKQYNYNSLSGLPTSLFFKVASFLVEENFTSNQLTSIYKFLSTNPANNIKHTHTNNTNLFQPHKKQKLNHSDSNNNSNNDANMDSKDENSVTIRSTRS